MRTILFLLLACCVSGFAYAQTTDSVDNIVLKIPASWQVNKQATYTELKMVDNSKKSFCQLIVYKALPAAIDRKAGFETEWKELVEKNFAVFTLAEPVALKTKAGTRYQRLGAKVVGSDGNKYYVQLNVYECGNSVQSIVAVSANQKQLEQYDSLWQSLIVNVKKDNNPVAKNIISDSAIASAPPGIVGVWHKSSSSPSAYTNGVLTNLAYSGYTKGEYNFKSDGSYTYQGESWSGYYNSTEFRLIDENGMFIVSNNQLIITPHNGLYRVVDSNGKLKQSEKLSLDKRTYTWQTHYYEGLQETALILTAKKENVVDGGFSSSQQFPNSFIYNPGKKLEFRFVPVKPQK